MREADGNKRERGLGFRDLEAFNAALLCKQIWRVITRPNLLMSKIMKYKYFPNGDIFDAISKAGDSWVWKNLNESKVLLKEGCSQQVGNGVRIKVWEDIQLKVKFWRKVSSSKPEACNVKNVKELMNQERGR